MECKVRWLTSPQDCWEAALFTRGKVPTKPMSVSKFKDLIMAEHSPIRSAILRIYLYDIPDRASVHLVRHVHSLHYVKTNRPDITGQVRGSTTNHMIDVNMEALRAMARKRLCQKASEETRSVMQLIVDTLMESEDEYIQMVAGRLVPSCVYRGGCHEINGCGYY